MKWFRTLLIISSICVNFSAFTQSNTVQKTVFSKCDSLLLLISVAQGDSVNWEAVNKLFVEDAALTMVGSNAGKNFNFTFDLDRFNAVDTYTKNGFKEEAIERQIWTTPSIAIVKEAYKATTLSDGKVENGSNIYTFVLTEKGWKIKSLIWESY